MLFAPNPPGDMRPLSKACYGKKTVFVFDKPGVGYNCSGLDLASVDSTCR